MENPSSEHCVVASPQTVAFASPALHASLSPSLLLRTPSTELPALSRSAGPPRLDPRRLSVNEALTDALSAHAQLCPPRGPRDPAYEWCPEPVLSSLYYSVLFVAVAFMLPDDTDLGVLEIFCSAVAGAHSVCTFAQYGANVLRIFSKVADYEDLYGRPAILLPLSFEFCMYYVSSRFQECSASGDSIRKEFQGLIFLHAQVGLECCVSLPVFQSAFSGFTRGITPLSEVSVRRGFHPASVLLVARLIAAPASSPSVIEACSVILLTYIFWFRPVSLRALCVGHVSFSAVPTPVLKVVETARKASGSSAAARARSRTLIVERAFAFDPESPLGTALVVFLRVLLARGKDLSSPLFSFSSEADMTLAVQDVMQIALSGSPEHGHKTEYTVYSGRIGGLTAALKLGSPMPTVNQWGGWVQGGTSWKSYMRPNILFDHVPADLAFARSCFSHLCPPPL